MKKPFTVLLILLAAALLLLAARLIVHEFNSPAPPEIEAEDEEEEAAYDRDLFAEFLAAEASGDYITMNRIFDENMEETGESFFDYDYDPTHGGKIYTYPYSVTVDGTEISGNLYLVAEDVDRSVLTMGENDYFAVDLRDHSDPNITVMDSYRATGDELIRCLCEILLEHEENYPSDWDRTLESMITEWEMHNAAYVLGYKVESAKDVDLNNADEGTDWLKKAAEELS